jgi:uncharacterized membrane protein YecN with MAPEG domain
MNNRKIIVGVLLILASIIGLSGISEFSSEAKEMVRPGFVILMHTYIFSFIAGIWMLVQGGKNIPDKPRDHKIN